MLIVSTKDGASHAVNLADAAACAAWIDLARTSAYQRQISSLTIKDNGVRYSIPRTHPEQVFEVEYAPAQGRAKGGERIVVYLDELQITLFVHRDTRAARVDIRRAGRRVFAPRSTT